MSMGFERSDLAIITARNHAGVTMGRKRLILGELVAPFPGREVCCEQRYYLATLPNRQSPKIQAFIARI